jgi:hypothetical protein
MLSLYGTRTKVNPDFDAICGGYYPEENNCSTITVQEVKLLQPVEVIASRLVHQHHHHRHDHCYSLERYIHKISNALHVYYSKVFGYSAPLTPGSRSLVVAIHPTGHCKVWLSTPIDHLHDSHHDNKQHHRNNEKVDDDLYEAEKLCVKSIESRIRPPKVQNGPIIFALIYSLATGGVEHNTQDEGQFRTPPEWIDVIMNSESIPTPDEIVSQLW